MMRHFLFCCLLAIALPVAVSAQEKKRPKLPNIVWITSEDHGPHMGCYGDKFARTPNVDKLAKKGMIFTRCWSNAPVCAPARTTIISGLYATSTGAHHMRSSTRLPEHHFMFPYYLRILANYYCTNKAKEDYNLDKTGKVWDDSSMKGHWRNRKNGQPFFAVFNSLKSHESQVRNPKVKLVSDPAKVPIPSYHPDAPQVREDWARYYDVIALADADAGQILRELEEAGLLEDTIIFYFADHGAGLPRSKRTPCNSGLQVPMVVYFPENWKHLAPAGYRAGASSPQPISFVDLAPTVLSIAGIDTPEWMQGKPFAGKERFATPTLHGFRGRMDERYDLQRSVIEGRFVYLRNYMPHLPAGQHVDYMFQTNTTKVWKKWYDLGKLNEPQSLFWKAPRAPEELYDLQSDPDEVKNLAASPAHKEILAKMRQAQREHVLRIRDVGFLPEDEIHRRAGSDAPYTMGHDKAKYPLERILDQADLASSLQADAVPKLQAGLKDPDNAIRYWSAMGLLIRGKDVTALRGLLADDAKPVRIVAAEALVQFGIKEDSGPALKVLVELAHPKKNTIFNSLAALNALDRLGEKVGPIAAELRALPTEGTPANHRAAPGIGRLLAKINGK